MEGTDSEGRGRVGAERAGWMELPALAPAGNHSSVTRAWVLDKF